MMDGILGSMLAMRSRLGIGAMLDGRRLSSWMADALRNAHPGGRQIILRILAEGLPRRMLAGEAFSEDQVRFQAGHISRTWFLREDMVLAGIRCWRDALAGAAEDGEDGAGAAESASAGQESDSGAPAASVAPAGSGLVMGDSMFDDIEAVVKREMVIFFLIDQSGSMSGSKIGALNTSIRELMPELRDVGGSDVDIKIAALLFSSGWHWMYQSPESAETFQWIPVDAEGMTDMGAAFKELAGKLSKDAFLKAPSAAVAPAIFLFSGSRPTDDYRHCLEILRRNRWFQHAIRVAVAIGDEADRNVLEEFTGTPEAVITVHTPEALRKMIRFVTVTPSRVGGRSQGMVDGKVDLTTHEQVARDIQDYFKDNPDVAPPQPTSGADPAGSADGTAPASGGAGDAAEIADFPGFAGFAVTVRGYDHDREDRPCQDYSKFHILQDSACVAVCDGHGEDRCFRSRQGAQWGVFCALRFLTDFMRNPEYRERLRTAGEEDRTRILRRLAERITFSWLEHTERHFERSPLTPEELDLCRRTDLVGAAGTVPWRPSHYGTTLLYACMAPDFAFASQIGDGRCLFLYGDGEEDCPIPGDGLRGDGRPASLCDDGAEGAFRHHFAPHREEGPVSGVFLATDGVTDFYPERNFRIFGRRLLGDLSRDRSRARAAVRDLRDAALPERSRRGSGGDVTIAGVFRKTWATRS